MVVTPQHPGLRSPESIRRSAIFDGRAIVQLCNLAAGHPALSVDLYRFW
jgi:hypothetical protein